MRRSRACANGGSSGPERSRVRRSVPDADRARGRKADARFVMSTDRGEDTPEAAPKPSATERVERLAQSRVAAALAIEACVGVIALDAYAPSLDASDPRVQHCLAALGDYASNLRACGVALDDALQDVAQLIHASVDAQRRMVLLEAAMAPVIAAYVPAGQRRDL